MRSAKSLHNQWRGIPPDVVQKLVDLDGSRNVGVIHWGQVELRGEFFRLSAEDQAAILGPAPNPSTVSKVEMKDLVHVVNAIAQQEGLPQEEVSPVPAGKLAANSLSDWAQSLLTTGSRKGRLVKTFFSKGHDPGLGDRVARSFRSKYEELRDKGSVGDDIFFELWRYAGGGDQHTSRHEAAVLAVLSFLFEECEIFEAPRTGTPE